MLRNAWKCQYSMFSKISLVQQGLPFYPLSKFLYWYTIYDNFPPHRTLHIRRTPGPHGQQGDRRRQDHPPCVSLQSCCWTPVTLHQRCTCVSGSRLVKSNEWVRSHYRGLWWSGGTARETGWVFAWKLFGLKIFMFKKALHQKPQRGFFYAMLLNMNI